MACISFLVDFIDLKRDCTGVIVDVREIFGESILQGWQKWGSPPATGNWLVGAFQITGSLSGQIMVTSFDFNPDVD